MPNINNSKLKKFLEGQNDQNLWSDLPDAHAEVVGGGQSLIPIPNITPLIGDAMTLGLNNASIGMGVGQAFAAQGIQAGGAAAEAVIPVILPEASNFAAMGTGVASSFLTGGIPGLGGGIPGLGGLGGLF
ncbi:MAG: hypothetical protein F6J89_12660 [Symploca sp. SIO1C4]|uniref:Uncharacterized protein n=1 Tax=Symploca sp. SIO1C4 TaxID=2607765 RepID=A0A6B3NCX2_9CYAN|nr:hypothetical protein [Symploca sp. SIO1C4]